MVRAMATTVGAAFAAAWYRSRQRQFQSRPRHRSLSIPSCPPRVGRHPPRKNHRSSSEAVSPRFVCRGRSPCGRAAAAAALFGGTQETRQRKIRARATSFSDHYCTVQYIIEAVHSTVLYCTKSVIHTVLYSTVRTVQYCTILYSATQHGTACSSTVQQYSIQSSS